MIFLFASFYVPTNSMHPTVVRGDYILVNKLIPGPRLFNIFATLQFKQVNIYRPFGFRKLQHNDIVVFNNPYPISEDTLEMHILKYYVKRCVGLPGDSLIIADSIYQGENIGRHKLYIPKAGDCLPLTHQNYILYHKLIAFEEKGLLEYKDSVVYLNNQQESFYTFKKNYYYMAGDNIKNSADSHYWGLLPEDFIVGKVWLIWKSEDMYTGELRWERILKAILK